MQHTRAFATRAQEHTHPISQIVLPLFASAAEPPNLLRASLRRSRWTLGDNLPTAPATDVCGETSSFTAISSRDPALSARFVTQRPPGTALWRPRSKLRKAVGDFEPVRFRFYEDMSLRPHLRIGVEGADRD